VGGQLKARQTRTRSFSNSEEATTPFLRGYHYLFFWNQNNYGPSHDHQLNRKKTKSEPRYGNKGNAQAGQASEDLAYGNPWAGTDNNCST